MDIVVASLGLVISAPVMLIIAAAIRLDSPGPAIFRHMRIGLNCRRHERAAEAGEPLSINDAGLIEERRVEHLFGRPFGLYKFRTMYVDAQERFPELYRYEYQEHELDTIPIKVLVGSERGRSGSGAVAKPGGDPRVTRVGRFLRRTSLDELPNLINVLTGDMALVGPRPDIAANIRWYRPEHLRKLEVKPGVTGLAQIKGRGLLPFHKINELDVEYVRRRSVLFDVKILFQTVWLTIRRHGAY